MRSRLLWKTLSQKGFVLWIMGLVTLSHCLEVKHSRWIITLSFSQISDDTCFRIYVHDIVFIFNRVIGSRDDYLMEVRISRPAAHKITNFWCPGRRYVERMMILNISKKLNLSSPAEYYTYRLAYWYHHPIIKECHCYQFPLRTDLHN